MNYTKGEWKRIYVPEAHLVTIAAVGLDSNHAIATINKKSFPDEWKANAQLIASAPDMYEALKGIVADLENYIQPYILEATKEALAKVEGKDGS